MTPRDRGARTSVAVGDEPASPRRGTSAHPGRKRLSWWQETALLLALALVMAIVIKALFVQAFYIPSGSMEPGLVLNDRILVQKVSYWFGGEPERGDVVVFEDPGGWLSAADAVGPSNPLKRALAQVGLYPEGGHLVKRVIGIAGDTITCCDEEGRITVNGQPLTEGAYIQVTGEPCNGPMVSCDWEAGPVPEGHVFVMGDNRGNSSDSTVHMCRPQTDCVPGEEFVSVDLVVGKVFALIWPADRFDLIGTPDAFAGIPDAS